MAYYGKLAEQTGASRASSRCFFSPHGGDMNGFALLRGSAEQLQKVRNDEEFRDLLVRANNYVLGVGVIDAYVGEGVQREVVRYAKFIESTPVPETQCPTARSPRCSSSASPRPPIVKRTGTATTQSGARSSGARPASASRRSRAAAAAWPEPRGARLLVAGPASSRILADLGILSAGGATTTVYPSSTAERRAYILADSRTRYVFVEDAARSPSSRASSAEMPKLRRSILIDGERRAGDGG